jgi:two-component system response regulator GlrR
VTGALERPTVLVIDDDVELAALLEIRLDAHGYATATASSAGAGLAFVAADPHRADVVLLDLRLPDGDGLDVLAQLRAQVPEVPVLILTAHGTIELAVEAMRRGAYGVLTKPFHDRELLEKLAQATESRRGRGDGAASLPASARASSAPPSGEATEATEHPLVGDSRAMARVREIVARVAAADVTVLIMGESGTGKELAARALHARSPRASRPFVAVNCAAMPGELLESELFGHVRGSFTGATRDRDGLFATASGSTLFLDEIGDASAAVQAKLLRVLQERRYTRVGSTTEEQADVRIVAATNRDLRADVAAGRFREDLLFRLHVVPIRMPALRDRREDVLRLAETFVARAAARHRIPAPRISEDAANALLAHQWPGNVRELANAMEAAILLSGTSELRAEHLRGLTLPEPAESGAARIGDAALEERLGHADADAPFPTMREVREGTDRAYLVAVLKRTHGNVTLAAKIAGRTRSDFYELMRRHSIVPSTFKQLQASSG